MPPNAFKWKHFSPAIILWCLRWCGSAPLSYANVNGKWFYLYRAIDKHGDTPGVCFSPKHNRYVANEFLRRILKPYTAERQPKTLNTDKHAADGYVIVRLIKEGKLRADVKQRQVKTLNNRIEPDHAPVKKLIVATGGFKSAELAWSTIQGIETLRKLNKGQLDEWPRRDEPEFRGREISAFVNRLFNMEGVLA